jgi:hypothetical protein
MKKTIPPPIKRLPAAKQRLMDKLLDKNSEGKISPSEKAALNKLVAEAEQLTIANGKALARFAQSSSVKDSAHAVPVTVWVTPQSTGG